MVATSSVDFCSSTVDFTVSDVLAQWTLTVLLKGPVPACAVAAPKEWLPESLCPLFCL